MANISILKSSFNAGELSPLLDGRSDIDKYGNGCSILENFIPTTQGALLKRPGTRFINNAHSNPGDKSWLFSFVFNLTQSFILEFRANYINFYYNNSLLVNADGTPYAISTPYSISQLTTDQGTFGLSLKQSADVIYIACDGTPPQKLERISNNNWLLTSLELKNGPFQDLNADTTKTISIVPNGSSPYHPPGDISVATSNFDVFTSDMVGTEFSIEPSDTLVATQWQQLTDYKSSDIVTNDGKFYLATGADGKSGYIAPIHTKGTQSDGGVNWYFIGYRKTYFKITQFIDSKNVNVTTTDNFYSQAYTSSPYWALYAWYQSVGYPTQVELFRSRLVFSRGQHVWFSKSGDFENFEAETNGNISDNSAISITTSSEGTSQIQNLTSSNIGLICSTDLDQIVVNNATLNLPFSPTNIQVNPGSGIGSRLLDIQLINDDLLFVTTSGNRICNLQYNANNTSFISPDITVMSEHILKPYIIDLAFQQNPYSILWMVRSDGELIGMTYNKEQSVTCFHRHNISNGKVLSVTTIPNPNKTQDDLWMVVQRLVNGVNVNYIEVMQPCYDQLIQNQQWFLDCALSYSGTTIQTITGLNHLIGQTVDVIGDDSYQGSYVVNGNGSINITFPATNIIVGLPYVSTMQTMRLETQTNEGTAQGAIKRINRVTLRMLNSMGLIQLAPTVNGNDDGYFDKVYFHKANGLLAQVAPLYTGDKYVDISSDYSEVGKLCIKHSEPYNLSLLCLVIQSGIYS